jgi:hypothetical protein
MTRTSWKRRLSYGVGVSLAGLAIPLLARGLAAEKAAPPNPPEAVVAADRGKSKIELPTERLLAEKSKTASVDASAPFENPRVEPGKVKWHADLEAACRAARTSGKPVLLFQMMGKLDQKFC